MPNVIFSYLYRDASNNKNGGGVIFTNPTGLDLESIHGRLSAVLDEREFFVPHQVRVPPVYHYLTGYGYAEDDDHSYHEFTGVTFTDEDPTDEYTRTIIEFLFEIEREARRGWQEFDDLMRLGISYAEATRLVALGPEHPEYEQALSMAVLKS